MTDKCDVNEIMKELKVLDSLKTLRENMGESTFMETFPELSGLGSKLDTVIEQHENDIQKKMEECGNLNVDELPEGTLTTDVVPVIEEPI